MALKIVYPICCGIDVHKTFVVACIASTDKKGVTSYKRHRFSTFTKGLRELLSWLLEHHCRHVCMESTGKYWIPVFNVLESDCSVVVAHPKFVRAIKGKKTDKKDAQWIADLFKHDLVSSSFIPPLIVRQIRDLMRYRFKLTCMKSSEKNRLQNSLSASNIQLASVVSDTFGKSSRRIISALLDPPENSSIDLESLIHGSLKKKLPDLIFSIDGFISREQAGKMTVILNHYDALLSLIHSLESLILELVQPFLPQIDLLLTVPSIKNVFSAIGILAEIGADMDVFPTAGHLCSWAGLTPTNNESAGKKKSVRISKAGAYIKPLLVQCANAAVRSDKYPEIKNRFLRIKKRRGHKRAIIAISRMLLTTIYHMLKNNEPYDSERYHSDTSLPLDRVISLDQAITILRSQGFRVAT